MSALRPHIRAARAYEQAWAAQAVHMDAAFPGQLPPISRREMATVHARAAEIMEVEQATEYHPARYDGAPIPGDTMAERDQYPLQTEGA